jgi:hypothetical protein
MYNVTFVEVGLSGILGKSEVIFGLLIPIGTPRFDN